MRRVVIGLIIITLQGAYAKYRSIARVSFIERYEVEPEIRTIIDQHVPEVFKKLSRIHRKSQKHGVWTFEWLPGYYIKYGIKRIRGMERLKRCINTYNLDLLTVPDKRLYHLKGRPHDLSDLNYAVVVKAVERSKDKPPLTIEYVTQLATVIKRAHYVDFNSSNYIRTAEGKLSLIDSEGIFDRHRHFDGFLRLIGTRHNLNTSFTKEALIYLFHELADQLEDYPEHISFCFSKLDDILDRQEQPCSWDYHTFYEVFFQRFRTGRRRGRRSH